VEVAHYLLTAAVIPVLVGFPAYAVFSAAGVHGLPRTVYSPAATVAVIAALAGAALLLPISFMAASWTIVGLLIGAAACGALATARRRGWRRLAPTADERRPLLLLLAAFAFLAGFNLMTSNPPGSINPCAPVPAGQQGYLPVLTGGPCAVVAPPGLTMARIPERAQDDLLQFRTAQAIWNRRLFSEREYSGGWLLQDRTPLLGLVTAGLGATSGQSIPSTYPPQVTFKQFGPTPLWLQKFGAPHDSSITPKTQPSAFSAPGYLPPLIDRWGYWFYRLLTIFLNTLVVLPTFALGTLLAGRRVGTLAAIATSLSPAIMTNAYYTSPKYLGLYFAFCGLLLVIGRRPALAGGCLGASYLCHPLGAVLAAAVVLYQLVRRPFRHAGVIVAAAVVIVAPWFVFTAEKGSSTNLVGYPLGCVGPSVTLDACWQDFVHRPVSQTVWQRVEILPELVVPASLSPQQPLQPQSRDGLLLKWMTAHDFAYPGMVGFAFFAFVVVGAIRLWPREKRLLAALLGGQLLAMIVIWGLPGWPGWVVGLGLLPIIYVLGAFGLATAGARVVRIGAFLIAAEWLIYLGALYRPISNVDAGQYLFGWALILGALAWLGRSAWSALRPLPGEARPQPTPRSSELDLHPSGVGR
jgi:hypothetical protein